MGRPLCRHCQKSHVNRPLGLCWHCYYCPGVRALYPSTSKYHPTSPKKEIEASVRAGTRLPRPTRERGQGPGTSEPFPAP